jgi:ribosomal protein L29
MAIIKNKEMIKMSNKDIEEKIKELRMELIKEKVSAAKGGKLKSKEIRRTIARLLTFNRLNQKGNLKEPIKNK